MYVIDKAAIILSIVNIRAHVRRLSSQMVLNKIFESDKQFQRSTADHSLLSVHKSLKEPLYLNLQADSFTIRRL